MIEQVRLKKTLMAGDKVWVEGSLINSPLPEILLEEIHLGTGTVEVSKQSAGSHPTDELVFVAERVVEKVGPDATTLTSMFTPEKPITIVKPKPLLKRRKK